MKNPSEILECIGVEPITAPSKMSKRYLTYGDDFDSTHDRLLVAILYTPSGEYIREIRDGYRLRCVTHGAYAASYYALTQRQTQAYLAAHQLQSA